MWTCPHCDRQTDDGFDICWTCRTPHGQTTKVANDPQKMIVTTTPTIATHDVVEYFSPVFGETVWGANILREFSASFTDAFGGRSSTYEDVLQRGRTEAILEMTRRAERVGANAVVDLDVKYETLNGTMFLICASGTAVRIRPKDQPNVNIQPESQNNPMNVRTGNDLKASSRDSHLGNH